MDDHEEKEFYKNYGKHVVARGVVATEDPAELHRKGQAAALDRFAKLGGYFIQPQRILEIGASTGAFLELLKGKDRCGVEPSDVHRRFLEQFCANTYRDLSDVPEEPCFETICLFHVFEHIKNPLEFLKQCARRLKKGGHVIIEVPYIEDPLLKLYNCAAFKEFYFQPMHPYVYSKRSLEHVFSQAGFRVKEFIYYQRYGLDNHLTWLAKGKAGGDPALSSIFRDQSSYKTDLERAQITDTIICVATR
jgi:SAM-dependent methyltransferase